MLNDTLTNRNSGLSRVSPPHHGEGRQSFQVDFRVVGFFVQQTIEEIDNLVKRVCLAMRAEDETDLFDVVAFVDFHLRRAFGDE